MLDREKMKIKKTLILHLLLLSLFELASSQNQPRVLPEREVNAYNDMATMLKFQNPPHVDQICNQSYQFLFECQDNVKNKTEQNLVAIKLWGSSLTGVIPEVISNFTYLNLLDLSINQLQGGIPASLGDLSLLETLDLSSNRLEGEIPKSLGKLALLTKLLLSSNQLNGSVPNIWKNLKKLKNLDLSENLLSGRLPDSLAQLSSLTTMYMHTNMLSKDIPKFLGEMKSLQYIDLGANNFTGKLPKELAYLKNLRELLVPSNYITGPIPDEYTQLKELARFSVAGNSMSGTIKSSFIMSWPKLSRLELMGNNFEGELPPEVFQLSGLYTLWVSDLKFSKGFEFPKLAPNLSSLNSLILRNCNLSGVIPPYLGRFRRLSYLDLSFNDLTGGIPNELQSLYYLSKLSVAGNRLNGTFPFWATNEDLLVDVSNNYLQLNRSLDKSTLSHMTLFNCCSNYNNITHDSSLNLRLRFSPTEIIKEQCPRLKSKHDTLYINCGSQEKFEDYDADNATSNVHISDGKWGYTCSGQWMFRSADSIKKAKCSTSPLFEAARFCPVSLTYYGFCMLEGQYNVQLHFSEIVYTEEEDYGSLKHRVFDVYIQDQLVFPDLNIKALAGASNRPWNASFQNVTINNSSLLKIHLMWAGKGAVSDDPLLNGPLISAISVAPVPKPIKSGELTPSQKAMIATASVFAPLLLLALCWKMGWLKNKEWQKTTITLRRDDSTDTVTVKDLINATNNFASENFLGSGNFGTVYRADLQLRNVAMTVAVKKLKVDRSKQTNLVANMFTRFKEKLRRKSNEAKPARQSVAKKELAGLNQGESTEQSVTTKKISQLHEAESTEQIVMTEKISQLNKAESTEQSVTTEMISQLNEAESTEQSVIISQPNEAESTKQIVTTENASQLNKGERSEQMDTVAQLKEVETNLRIEKHILQSLKHENLIHFFDSYSRKDLHLLVYEFMENGSLEKALFDGDSKITLDWKARSDICLGIAKGLKYLHNEKANPIVHRDIKASNVLLDKTFKAKISDFGLATKYDETNCIEAEVGGTNGYMAPEYAQRGIFSDKTDIYSFGVLLLEIVSGQSNIIEKSARVDYLLDKAAEFHKKDKITELVDRRLAEYSEEEAYKILGLAMICIDSAPAFRPNISEVVDVLENKLTIELKSPLLLPDSCKSCSGTGKQAKTSTSNYEGEASLLTQKFVLGIRK